MPTRRLFLILGGVAFALLVVILAARDAEPAYRGRSLSYWLRICRDAAHKAKQEEAETAVCAIGTNALPQLIQWITAPDPGWGFRFRLNRSLRRLGLRIKFPMRPAHAELAMTGFKILGARAAPAIPSLAHLLNQTNQIAAFCLGRIGKDSLPVLLAGLTNPSPELRITCTLDGLREMGSNAAPAVPVLMQLLQDPLEDVSQCAAVVLVSLGLEPSLVVQELSNLCRHERASHRAIALEMLKEFGDTARPTLPVILKALGDNDASVRSAATNALEAVAPEVLTNAPPQ